MCYVGKATKIFFFIVGVLAVTGLVMALGLLRRSWAHKEVRPCDSNVACHAIFPDPIPANTAAAPAIPTISTTPTNPSTPTTAATNPPAAATTTTTSTAVPPLLSPPSSTLGPVPA